ncbi:Crp/Fnr family transcriptional regulator [Chryseobacterium arthrosphaerae]|uniref:Crp/Fnr family transcriptional regulator n=1 Tax=Chryseobacterium arthrosphaerae TaxID=651561 RepID=UPI0023E1C252|nr:Crp/Fnr family transcriptional regulator [Chryseobacterium arthrosphaerae]WES98247.1 Crp/Fnr family transcriptional regulator [Chryseobacterium arthrosphaerae]
MVIPEELLLQHGAVVKSYSENENIFSEGSCSKYYYQIHDGIVKICNTFDDGKEFVHGFPFRGHCFGESYLFTNRHYGISATAITTCTVFSLGKEDFFKLVLNNPEILLDVNYYTAERLHFRYLISSFLAIGDPLIRIQKLLDHLKDYFGFTEPYSFQVPFTRNELASLTGLRVETIIRVIKKMHALQILKIDRSKIFY